jgi:hypothetical protein
MDVFENTVRNDLVPEAMRNNNKSSFNHVHNVFVCIYIIVVSSTSQREISRKLVDKVRGMKICGTKKGLQDKM